eukprot:7056943-Pyramimonas_sp.AAC.1
MEEFSGGGASKQGLNGLLPPLKQVLRIEYDKFMAATVRESVCLGALRTAVDNVTNHGTNVTNNGTNVTNHVKEPPAPAKSKAAESKAQRGGGG